MRSRNAVSLATIVLLLASSSVAGPMARPTMRLPPNRGPAAAAAANAADAGGSVDASAAGDAGTTDETPDQRAKRIAYVDATAAKIRTLTRANGKQVTSDERDIIRRHWRQSMRLWRIRDLAQNTGDAASVTRVDALLLKADQHLDTKLRELNAKAPKKEASK